MKDILAPTSKINYEVISTVKLDPLWPTDSIYKDRLNGSVKDLTPIQPQAIVNQNN
jgi:hypothetical protein